MSQWHQKTIGLTAKSRGFHLVTAEITEQLAILRDCQIGILHLLLQHTSASLTLNENADPTVRGDFERFFNHNVPEHAPYFQHTYEGPDDMPAHLKASLLGTSLTIPVNNGKLALGTWQGIYLGEHRNQATSRRVIATLNGQFR
ncbi:secondary thiamine-phosphate synthase enzyme YjbQ [Bowmanella pacifica]|uniref:Secondary thiamine-phosphate synthase enzyme n=1 Tax=Bowmanella pacifica TaxID=502051 RepID=A0A917Z4M1_9ALTE|nr:secondary thiamine-phosphate synthase enzyme YjbQ [Bowmanella pacifica]GGO75186.1 hypothetical protein GCM10010982_39760 [Bowmanella pacifica]